MSAHESDPRWRYATSLLTERFDLPATVAAGIQMAAVYEQARIELEYEGITNPLEHFVAEAVESDRRSRALAALIAEADEEKRAVA
jgi:hypothetical protein